MLAACAHSSGAPATTIPEPGIAAAYLPLYGRMHLGLDSAVGAAVVIAPGIAVTNDHNDDLVASRNVLGFGSASDLMFFRTARTATPQTAAPAMEEAVAAYGQGANRELRVAHGVICNIAGGADRADSPYFIFVGNAGPGFSGGPVVDSAGRLIGITFGYVDRGKNRRLIFAYDMKRVTAEFQLKKPVKWDPGDDKAPPTYGACDHKS
jgi:S1-C subfamily serine protease